MSILLACLDDLRRDGRVRYEILSKLLAHRGLKYSSRHVEYEILGIVLAGRALKYLFRQVAQGIRVTLYMLVKPVIEMLVDGEIEVVEILKERINGDMIRDISAAK